MNVREDAFELTMDRLFGDARQRADVGAIVRALVGFWLRIASLLTRQTEWVCHSWIDAARGRVA